MILTHALLFVAILYIETILAQEAMPPSITSLSDNYKYFKEGESVILNCQADGIPKPRYRWIKDGQPLVETSTGDLVLQSPQEGGYQCNAQNDYGVDVSETIHLVKASLEVFPTGFPHNAAATEYTYHRLPCPHRPVSVPQSTKDVLQASITGWRRGTLDIDTDDRNVIDSEGTLHFVYTLGTDASTSEDTAYRCYVTNSVLNDEVISDNPTILTIHAGNASVAVEPQDVFSPDKTAWVGSDVYLECIFMGYAPDVSWKTPNISWFDPAGHEIIAREHHLIRDYGRWLILISVQVEQEGQYTCTASGSNATAEGHVYLNVTGPPILSEPFDDIVAVTGETITCVCRAHSPPGESPAAGPVWQKNGASFPDDSNGVKYTFSSGREEMTIHSLERPSDIACYQCKYTNAMGELFRRACVNVIDPIIVHRHPEGRYEISLGDDPVLFADATVGSGLTLTYQWFYSSIPLTSASIYTVSPDSKTLTINTTELKTSNDVTAFRNILGVYTLTIRHKYKQKSFAFKIYSNLLQLYPITLLRWPVNVTTVSLGDVITLDIQAQSVLPLQYTWFHGDKRRVSGHQYSVSNDNTTLVIDTRNLTTHCSTPDFQSTMGTYIVSVGHEFGNKSITFELKASSETNLPTCGCSRQSDALLSLAVVTLFLHVVSWCQ